MPLPETMDAVFVTASFYVALIGWAALLPGRRDATPADKRDEEPMFFA